MNNKNQKTIKISAETYRKILLIRNKIGFGATITGVVNRAIEKLKIK